MESCHTTAPQQLVRALATRLFACRYRCQLGKLQIHVNQSCFNSLSLSPLSCFNDSSAGGHANGRRTVWGCPWRYVAFLCCDIARCSDVRNQGILNIKTLPAKAMDIERSV